MDFETDTLTIEQANRQWWRVSGWEKTPAAEHSFNGGWIARNAEVKALQDEIRRLNALVPAE